MDEKWLSLLQEQSQLGRVLKLNQETEKYGLVLNDGNLTGKERCAPKGKESRVWRRSNGEDYL